MTRIAAGVGFLLMVVMRLAPGAETAAVQPRSVRALVADGKHNAFTALVHWREADWLAFRAAASHNSGDGDIVVLRSPDGETWSEALRLNVLPDDRDPQFLATADRLFLYDPAMEGSKLTSFAVSTADGETWSQPQPVYEPQFIFWKPLTAGERFYATAHRKAESDGGGKLREVHLITSNDGLQWDKVSTMRAGNWESETTLYLRPDGKMLGFIRTKYSVAGHVLESRPPYAEWTQRPAGVHLSGHCVRTIGGVPYLFSRTMDESGGNQGAAIYTIEGDDLKLYCTLPAGGDCSYPDAVERGDDMLVSYYSSHEGQTNIYLARVPLR